MFFPKQERHIFMTDFPPNSRASRIPASNEPAEPDAKKVEKVVTGEVVTRKKPLGKRVKETLLFGDGQTVWEYILMDVIVPATKDLIADTATSAVERMLFGDGHHYGRRGSSGRPRSRSNTDYSKYTKMRKDRYSSNNPPWERSERTPPRSAARANHDFRDFILETRAEAEEVIERMFDLTEKYEMATVADLYDLLGVPQQYTDDKWGWYDVRRFEIRRVRDGYLLDIPKPEPID